MRPSYYILAALLDEKEHKVSELLPYFMKRLDPTKAARNYHQRFKCWRKQNEKRTGEPLKNPKAALSLEKQIESGARSILASTLWSMAKHGYIEYSKQAYHNLHERTVRLTPSGKALLFRQGKNSPMHTFWKEVRQWYINGWLTITLNPCEETPSFDSDTDPNTNQEQTNGCIATGG